MRRSSKGPLIKFVSCPRCGKSVATSTRSLVGAEALKRKYEGICSGCITPEENNEIMQGQAAAILRSAKGEA